jgi:hypothetical protein
MNTFVQELKNRRVYRVSLAYLVAGSAAVQVVGTVLPTFHAPDWAQQVFVVLIAMGFPMALVLAWSFDVKEGSIKKTGPCSRGAVTSCTYAPRRMLIVRRLGGERCNAKRKVIGVTGQHRISAVF